MESNKITVRIKGHEKFVLREGWLNKGILAFASGLEVWSGGNNGAGETE